MSRFDNSPDVEVEGISFGTFGKAMKFQGDYWDEPQFLPLSQITVIPLVDGEEKGRCKVLIAAWLAKKNGWTE